MTTHTVLNNKTYWDSFYKDFKSAVPSQFCVSVVTDLEEEAVIVELGSGNGKDALFFASQGHTVVAMDLSAVAIESSQKFAEAGAINNAYFFQGDITNKIDIGKAVDAARVRSLSGSVVVYSRFVMHSLDESQQANLLEGLGAHMMERDVAYFEFRSREDASLVKHFGGHYRRYVDTERFERELAEVVGLKLMYSITGQGLARFKNEDPMVSRVIAKKGL